MLLYKYRDDSKRTEEIFSKGKVWLSTASQLNDPIECQTGKLDEEWKQKKIEEMEDSQFSGFVCAALLALKEKKAFFGLPYASLKPWLEKLLKLDNRKERFERMRAFQIARANEPSVPSKFFERFEQQLASVGIFSLTEAPDNNLMWSHYANGHKGLAIGFAKNAESKLGSNHTLQVQYSDTKPTFSDEGFTNQLRFSISPKGGIISKQQVSFEDKTFRAAFSTKPNCWTYEKEWRYVEESSGLFPWPGPIEAVVFGLKMDSDRRKFYFDLVEKHVPNAVAFYEVVFNNGQFACKRVAGSKTE